ncbi:putative cation exchanger [Neolecta irregularis DAH-3]|uniref:Putative cation exchanger n=1 Tax=Neolecta irregularis (strain DAH-3) TaxID=1198029 RepID=A0A1U7LQ02_NEOID|nr:putative cation exchanger [Neolecta irregularis DAH-3]|eukprot:OLL24709.1 putative cation exchanger [Neolecta irregularis DAH-3]
MENAKFTGVVLLAIWLSLLFSTIGIAASEFFCPNLAYISHSLGISENIAGVTFLAFGNGAPDVFSTFAAMKAGRGSLAVGELLGAASFIVAVVLGSMAIVRPFKVAQREFFRDVGVFMVAAFFTMVMISDGILHLWESFALIGIYALYVVSIISDSWYSTTKKAHRITEILSRNRFATPGTEYGAEELDEHTRLLAPDIGDLEHQERDDPSEQEEYTNLNHRMTIMRSQETSVSCSPRIPIRPSLLGALEFRSIVTRLAQESSDVLRLQKSRSYDRSSFEDHPASLKIDDSPHVGLGLQLVNGRSPEGSQSRQRSLSASAIQPTRSFQEIPELTGFHHDHLQSPVSHDISNALRKDFLPKLHNVTPRNATILNALPESCTWDSIPNITISPALPETITAVPPSGLEHLASFWPDGYLSPLPDIIYTLFPTLENLTTKSPFQILLSVMAVPTVFLLKVTVPVVHSHHGRSVAAGFEDGSSSVLENRDESDVSSFPSISEKAPPWKRWLVSLQSMTIPILLALLFFPGRLLPFLYALLSGSMCWLLIAILTNSKSQPGWLGLLSYVGFFVGTLWISSIANEVVGVLQALGIILNISDAILGLTVFAMGNSLGDLIANVTVAKMGFPMMAMSACFGGPMLNILIGIGASGIFMNIKHPGNSNGYHLEVSPHLVVSATSLLVSLVILLMVVPKYGMSRKIGMGLIFIYISSLIVNLVLEFNITTNEFDLRGLFSF